MGLSRLHMLNVMRRHEAMQDEKEVDSFLTKSGYHRKVNQQLASLPFDEYRQIAHSL